MKRYHQLLLTAFTLALMLGIISAAGTGMPEAFADYHGWHRANVNKIMTPSAHPEMKDVYFNDAAAEGFDAAEASFSFPHADGSVFVKETLDPDSLEVTVLAVMRKVEGFDADHGDWEWGMWERNGDGLFEGGWLELEAGQEMCAECHSRMADNDFTFVNYLGR